MAKIAREPLVRSDNFRMCDGRRVSSIGLGTYLGTADDETDRTYREAIQLALESGCNVFDTAINYRYQQSERNIGTVLTAMIRAGRIDRRDVFVSTKGGFLAFDRTYSAAPARYFYEEFVQPGICGACDLVAGCHCLSPAYLEDQLERSLSNLSLDSVDVYYLHNPEIQLTEVSRPEFLNRMREAFALMEKKVDEGKIGLYGTATWEGYRLPPGAPLYLSLAELRDIAVDVAGERHHFRAVQLPYNLAMPEASLLRNQHVDGSEITLLEACQRFGMHAFTSATLLQGRLARDLPDSIRKVLGENRTDAQRAIQFARSTPGVTTALIGMGNASHVREDLQVAGIPPMSAEQMRSIFRK